MKEITFDFKNKWVLINTESQDTSEDMWELIQKPSIKEYIPSGRMYLAGDNFTLDFEKNEIRMNKSVEWDRRSPYTRELLEPEESVENDKLYLQWDNVVARMGYANIDYEMRSDYMDTVSFLSGLLE